MRIALRYVGGGWGIYVYHGSGWEAYPNSEFNFGQYEVSAKVRVDDSWGMSEATSTSSFFRAITHDHGFIVGVRDVGDVYPRDLAWQQALHY